MIGLVVRYKGKTYKAALPNGGVTFSSCIRGGRFTLELGGAGHAYAGVFQKLREGIEFEVEVTELDESSEPLSEKNLPINDGSEPPLDPDWELKYFRKIEAILKEEGMLD